MFRKLVLLSALLTVSAPAAARADTFYGGSAVRNGVQRGASVALVVHADGSVAARAYFTYGCRRLRLYNLVVPMKGRVTGSAVSATGKIPRRGARTIRYTLSGTGTPDAVTGKLKLRNHCGNTTRDLALRAMGAPAGAPVAAPRGTTLYGVTGH